MTYDQFIVKVKEQVVKGVADSVTVTVHTAVKNNGIMRKGLTFTEHGSKIAPTIYLEEYYQRFQKGLSEEQAAGEILTLYAKVRFGQPFQADSLSKYEEVREKVVYRLVNRKANAALLDHIPYQEYLDLAVIFYVLVEVNDYGMAAMSIRKEHLELWGVSEEEIFRQAHHNTHRILPEELQTMQSVLLDITGEGKEEKPEDMLYVLSNRLRSHGAAAILYDGCLEKIADRLASSYYVLPSSIHEVIITPDRHLFSYRELSKMVKEINETQVEPEEVLSDHAYYYDKKKKRLTCFHA